MQEINSLILFLKPIFPLSFSPNYEIIVLFADVTMYVLCIAHTSKYITLSCNCIQEEKGKTKPEMLGLRIDINPVVQNGNMILNPLSSRQEW
jgi:hypothetical protein